MYKMIADDSCLQSCYTLMSSIFVFLYTHSKEFFSDKFPKTPHHQYSFLFIFKLYLYPLQPTCSFYSGYIYYTLKLFVGPSTTQFSKFLVEANLSFLKTGVMT